jgi:uncharacterized membrane protein YcaP (DUF421 family)
VFHLGVSAIELVARSAAIYLVLLLALRLFGKREVGQFTLYDLVFVLLVANAVQPAMTGTDSSLLGGVIIIATLVVLNLLVSRLDSLPFFHRFFTSEPTLLIKDGQVYDDRCRREGIDTEELQMAIREHGLEDASDVAMGVLEPDGSISIVGKDSVTRTHRRLRRRYRPGR